MGEKRVTVLQLTYRLIFLQLSLFKMPGKPFLIGVAGGTSSGKTSVCKKIVEHLESTICLGNRKVAIINQESFHNHLTKDEMNIVEKNQYNFDHPGEFLL